MNKKLFFCLKIYIIKCLNNILKNGFYLFMLSADIFTNYIKTYTRIPFNKLEIRRYVRIVIFIQNKNTKENRTFVFKK